MLQLYRFFRDEKGLEQTDIYYQAHVVLNQPLYQPHIRKTGAIHACCNSTG